MDLDGFKRVNDVAGHETGDRLLREVASGLRQTLRAHDIVGRFGGDEFCVALVAADPDDATAVLDRIRATISDLALAKAFDVTISIGSVTVGGVSNPSSLEQAIREADKLMYEAKTRSKRRVRSPLLAESATGELSPTPGPRDALASIGPS